MRWLPRLPAALLLLGCGPAASQPLTVPIPASLPAPEPAPVSEAAKACEQGTVRILRELTGPLEVTVWVTGEIPKRAAFAAALGDLFAGYERLVPGAMSHRVIDVKTAADRAAAKEDGIMSSDLGADATEEVRQGFLGVAFKYKSEKETIPVLSPEQPLGIALWVAGKIREIHDRADHDFHTIGLLTGKDEIKLSEANLIAATRPGQGPSMKGIIEQALPFYKLEDVDLQGGEAEIDEHLSALVVTQPAKDFTEKELRRIDQFLMRGKSLAVYAGAVNMKANDAGMRAELHTHGLERLLDAYGVELRKDAVFDSGQPAVVRVATQNGSVKLAHPAIIRATYDARAGAGTQSLDSTFPGFFRMEEVAFPFPSTLVPHADRQPDATLRVVARTTPQSTAVTADAVEMKPRREPEPQGERGQRAIAVALEGTIRSAFAGRSDPAVPAPAESRFKSRLLVVASPQFLTNPWARAGNPPPRPPQQMAATGSAGGDEELMMVSQPYAQQYLTETILAFKDNLDWMTLGDEVLACATLPLLLK